MEPMKIEAKINIGKPPSVIKRTLTYERLCEWIRDRNLDEETTEGLILQAGRYPVRAYERFQMNIDQMIMRVRKKRDQLSEDVLKETLDEDSSIDEDR